jgi:hypothetical protein
MLIATTVVESLRPLARRRSIDLSVYSPSPGQTFLGELPPGYDGQFGPGLKSFTWLATNVGLMSQPKLLEAAGQR